MPYLLFSEALLPAWRRGRPASPSRDAEAAPGLGPRVRAWGGAGAARAQVGAPARSGARRSPGEVAGEIAKAWFVRLAFGRCTCPGVMRARVHLCARVGAVLRTGGAVPRDAMWRPLPRASVRVATGPTRLRSTSCRWQLAFESLDAPSSKSTYPFG